MTTEYNLKEHQENMRRFANKCLWEFLAVVLFWGAGLYLINIAPGEATKLLLVPLVPLALAGSASTFFTFKNARNKHLESVAREKRLIQVKVIEIEVERNGRS